MGKTVDAKNRIDHWDESEQDKVIWYERIIEKLKSTLDWEWKSLKLYWQQYQLEMASKTELEALLKECVEQVKQEI